VLGALSGDFKFFLAPHTTRKTESSSKDFSPLRLEGRKVALRQ
jgi:hypothetical protein